MIKRKSVGKSVREKIDLYVILSLVGFVLKLTNRSLLPGLTHDINERTSTFTTLGGAGSEVKHTVTTSDT